MPPFGFRTSCRISSARACSRRRSFPCTRGCSRERRRARRRRASRARCRAARGRDIAARAVSACSPRPWLIAAHRAGIRGRQARAHDHARARFSFPGAGLLVLSAWCLGVLNSHRRFLLSYSAPIVWNLAIIAALIWQRAARAREFDLAIARRVGVGDRQRAAASRAAADGVHAARHFRPCVGHGVGERAHGDHELRARCSSGAASCRSAATSTSVIASSARHGRAGRAHERAGAVHAAGEPLRHERVGGRAAGDVERVGEKAEVAEYLRSRLDAGLRRIAFLVVPSRDGVSRARRRSRRRAVPVGAIHARRLGVRLEHSRRLGRRAARLDARPALLVDVLRAARHAERRCATRWCASCSRAGSDFCSRFRSRRCSASTRTGARRGLTASAGIAGWVEFTASAAHAQRAHWAHGTAARRSSRRLWLSAAVAAAAAWGVKELVGPRAAILLAVLTIVPYGAVYFGADRGSRRSRGAHGCIARRAVTRRSRGAERLRRDRNAQTL